MQWTRQTTAALMLGGAALIVAIDIGTGLVLAGCALLAVALFHLGFARPEIESSEHWPARVEVPAQDSESGPR